MLDEYELRVSNEARRSWVVLVAPDDGAQLA